MFLTQRFTTIVEYFFVFFVLVCVGASPVSAASRYFDSVSGSDVTGDGSFANPWQSVVKLQEQVQWAQPGDVIYLKAGSSWSMNDLDGTNPAGLNIVTADTGLAFYSSGTSGSPITFQAYGTGVAPTFTNPSRSGAQSEAVFLLQGSYWIIDGIIITAGTIPASGINGEVAQARKGLFLYQGTQNILRNLEITGVGEGIYIEADQNLISQNHIHDVNMITNSNDSSNNDSGAVCIVLSGSHNEVKQNTLENCQGDSFDFAPTYMDGGALEIYAKTGQPVDENYIHHNTAQNSEGFMELGGQSSSTADNNVMAYNLIKNNTRLFYFNLDGSFPVAVTRHKFYHNTVVETGESLYGYLLSYSMTPMTSGMLEMKNNIFSFNSSFVFSNPLGSESVIAHANNLYYSLGAAAQNNSILGFQADASDVFALPNFVSSSNYALQQTSAAINLAQTLGTVTNYLLQSVSLQETDANGDPVPQQGVADSGAFESAFLPPTPSPTASSNEAQSSSVAASITSVQCPADIMLSTPSLFEARTKSTSVDLFIAPGSGAYTKYHVAYGTSADVNQFGTEFATSDHSGVIKYTIRDLQPNTRYYFAVKSAAQCSSSGWSAVLPVKTLRRGRKNTASFYLSVPIEKRLRQLRM